MKKLLILFLLLSNLAHCQDFLKKTFKFSTFYVAANGGTSISDVDVYSVTDGLQTQTIQTPFDYNFTFGVRKIARFGYENRANTFYDGTESSFSDAATIGKVKGFEFLFEADIKRQEGVNYKLKINQAYVIITINYIIFINIKSGSLPRFFKENF